MAEFKEVTYQWRRMCNEMCDMNGCEDCPIKRNFKNAQCGDMPADIMNIDAIETAVMEWAKDHPEPQYPTWWKYMCMIGVIPDELGDKTLGEMTVYSLMNTHIQSDIAEKLGIEPKEEV